MSLPTRHSVTAAVALLLAVTFAPSASASSDAPAVKQDFVLEFDATSGELTDESRSLLAVLAGCTPRSQSASNGGSAGPLRLKQEFRLGFDPQTSELDNESRTLLAVLAGCTRGTGSYVVLLQSPDGTVGRVVVRSRRGGEQELTEARTGLALDGSGPSFAVSSEQLERDFGLTMSARPTLPEKFQLYFKLGGTDLTDESKALIPLILEAARTRERIVQEGSAQRGTVDISIIGHTDTLGSPESNIILGFKRASAIASLLQKPGMEKLTVSVESQGKTNPLVITPDKTAEPRNRRVEITLR